MKTNLTIFFRRMFMSVFMVVMLSLLSLSTMAQTYITIGTGTSTNYSYSYPAPYGQFYNGAKHQMLILASEMVSSGATSGTITSLAFNVGTANGVGLIGFSIKIGTTTATSLTSTWETGLTTVYTSTSYTDVSGWNTHSFSTPFFWDGVSNIVVETCFDNYPNGYTNNAQMYYTTTSFNSVNYYSSDGGGVCGNTSISSTSTNRPNMKFGMSLATPPQTDLGILSWDYPYSSCGMSSSESIMIKVKNYGTAAQSSYSVKYSINGGSTWVTQPMTTTIPAGDTLPITFTTTADFSTVGTYNCLATVILANDSGSWNDTVTTTITSVAGLSIPYFENFENWTVGSNVAQNSWTNTSGEPHWEVEDATGSNENSSNTGPFYDHTSEGISGGKYIYLETSSGFGATSYFQSPCVNFGSATAVIMKFWYHMYGATMGTLEVEQKVNGNWISTGWSKTGEQQTAGNSPWLEAVVSINPAADGIRFKGSSATSYTSDMSIDDITIYIPQPNDLAMLEWTSPISGSTPSATMPITMKVVNMGTAFQDSIPLKYSIDGGTTFVTEMSYDTLFPGDTLSYTFTTTANMAAAGYYSCVGVVANPGDAVASNDTITLNPYLCSSLSGTYTIGPDTSDDFNSFYDAVFALENCGVAGAVIFNVDSGTYNEQVTIGSIYGVSATNTITFKSASGVNTDVVLTNSASNSAQTWTVGLSGASYVTFKDMTIEATGTYGYTVYLNNGSSYNTFDNNNIKTVVSSSSYFAAVYDASASVEDFNAFTNNTITGGYYGMYIYGSSSSVWEKGTVIEGNDISDFYYYGIVAYYQDSIQIIDNVLHDPTYGYYGIYTYYNFNGFNYSKNKIVMNGTSSTKYALRVYYNNYYSYAGTSAPGIVANNFITTVGGNGYGLYAYYSDNVYYYYNSVNIVNGTSGYALYQYNTTSNTNGQTFMNNIFSNTSGGYAAYFGTTAAVAGSDYNDLYATGTNLAYWGGAKTDLTALQTASSMDANSVSVNPGFFSATDLHVNTAAIDGIAYPVSVVTDDIDGELRSTTIPDIGADEFIVINHDAGITEIVAPVAPCPGTSAIVEVKLKNFGIQSLSSCSISWTVNGVAQSTVSFGGTLAPLNDTVIAIGSYTFAANTSYDIKVWTSNPNSQTDQKFINDTLFVAGKQTAMPAGTYTIGPDATDNFASFGAAVAAMSANGICGAVVFAVDSGSYLENVAIPEIMGTSASNTITFRSANYDSTSVVLTSDNGTVLYLNGADYVTFQNISIIATSIATTAVEIANGANYNSFIGNIMEVPMISSSSYSVIFDYSTLNHFNTYKNNKLSGGYYGMYLNGSSSSNWEKGTVIDGNEISDYYYYGIRSYYQDSIQITNNYIHDGTYGYYGIYTYYCFNGFNYSNNKIVMNGTSSTKSALRVYYNNYYSYAGTSAAGMVANNMIIVDGGNGYGIYAYYSNNVTYLYNSVNIVNGTSGYALYQYNTTSNTSGQSFYNNIFSNTSSGYAAYFGTTATVAGSDYNDLYATGTNLAYWGGAKTDLTALQTASSKDANSISTNPAYDSDYDLHLSPFSPINLGTPVIAVTTDFDGETRSTTAPDMGADEWDPLAHDIYMYAFVSPSSSICGDANDSIRVELKNWGTNIESNVTIYVTGTTPNGPYSTSYVMTSIPLHYSGTVTLGAVNTTNPGTYSFTAYSVLTTDLDHSNDTLMTSITTPTPYAVPYVEDFETSPYNWGLSSSLSIGTDHGMPSNGLFVNMYSSVTNEYAYLMNKVGTIPANAYFVFDYRITNWSGGGATSLMDDSIKVWVSTDCGTTASVLYVVDSANHTPSTSYHKVMVPMTSYVGNNIMFQFENIWDAGDYWVDIDNIGIGTMPVVDLGVDSTFCVGDSLTLDAGTDSVYSYTYDWYAVGNPASLGNMQYLTVDSTATYYVVKTNQLGLHAADTVMVTVNPTPIVSITGLNATYCSNDAVVTLTGAPTGGSFTGVGVTGSTFDPSAAGVGNMYITYSVVGSNGCVGTSMNMVTVNEAPVANAGSDVAICFGDSTVLEATNNVKDPFFSEYEEGSSNNKIMEIYNGTGAPLNMDNYKVLTNSNGSAWSGMYSFPVGTTIANGDVYVIANSSADSVLLSVADEQLAYNANGYMTAFNGNDVRALVKMEPNGDTTIVDLIGLYNLVNPGSGWPVAGIANATVNHTLVRKPDAGPNYGNFAQSQGTDSLTSEWLVYPQNTWTFAGSHTYTGAPVSTNYAYAWSNSANTQSTTVMPTMTTTYMLTVTNTSNSCSAMDSVEVMVNALPTINLGADFNLCENDMSTLDAGAGFVGYMWSNMDTTQTIDFYGYDLGVGTSTVFGGVLDSNGCVNVDSVNVTVLAAPVVNLGSDFHMKWIEGKDTLDAGAGFASYTWNNGWTNQTLPIGYATNVVGPNTYWVVVTNADNCSGSDTIVVTADDDTGFEGVDDMISVSVYPNPTHGDFQITMDGYTGAVKMEIVDLTGKTIYTEALDIHNNFVKSMDISTFATGVYYLRLTTDKHSQMHKIVVQ